MSVLFILSTSSRNKAIFDKYKGKNVEAAELGNHKIKLEFLANSNKDAIRPELRRLNITWFNLPFNKNVNTNIGFFKI